MFCFFHRKISINFDQLWNSICLQVPLINAINSSIFYSVWLNVMTAFGGDEGSGSFLFLYSESECYISRTKTNKKIHLSMLMGKIQGSEGHERILLTSILTLFFAI